MTSYDDTAIFCKDGAFCHFELSLESEKSTEFKILLKALKSHFKFVDTSLRSVWHDKSVWQAFWDTSLSCESSVWQIYQYDKNPPSLRAVFTKTAWRRHKNSNANLTFMPCHAKFACVLFTHNDSDLTRLVKSLVAMINKFLAKI